MKNKRMEKIYIALFLLWLGLILFGCECRKTCSTGIKSTPPKDTPANAHMNQTKFETLVERFEGKDRDQWQKPEEVVAALGNIENKKIIDIGAGTGYFSLRLAASGAIVTAADIDERFLSYMENRLRQEPPPRGSIALQHVLADDPLMEDGSMDMAFTVNTYHHIRLRDRYFSKVKSGLKSGGKLVVIDFKKGAIPVGPPSQIKVSPQQVEEELSRAGFQQFHIDTNLLPYQFIVFAE